MPRYWKACELDVLRRFPGWVEPSCSTDANDSTATVAYLDERCAVRLHPLDGAPIIYADESAAWSEFCRTEIGFSVPDWHLESTWIRNQFSRERH